AAGHPRVQAGHGCRRDHRQWQRRRRLHPRHELQGAGVDGARRHDAGAGPAGRHGRRRANPAPAGPLRPAQARAGCRYHCRARRPDCRYQRDRARALRDERRRGLQAALSTADLLSTGSARGEETSPRAMDRTARHKQTQSNAVQHATSGPLRSTRLNSIRRIIVSTVLAIAPGLGAWAATPAPASSWPVVQRHVLGGSGGWDYLAFEPDSPRLYISHADRVVVLDVASGKQVGAIDGLSGVHGIAFAPALHRGFISNGKADSVSVFDPATRKVTQTT